VQEDAAKRCDRHETVHDDERQEEKISLAEHVDGYDRQVRPQQNGRIITPIAVKEPEAVHVVQDDDPG
jgi:hypothetical protein